MDLEFKDFGKIARFRTLQCTVTEKIDGTNAQIYVSEDPESPILVGSRNRWITPQQDNYGFAAFVHAHGDAWRALGPGRHFGEWYGAGIQRRYGLSEKRFALFNVSRYAEGLPEGLPSNVHLVPVLYQGPLDTVTLSATTETLYTNGSVAVPGWSKPEGVIIECAGQRWKVTDNGDAHKGATTTHKEAVQDAARIDREKREANETALDRALRAVKVRRIGGDFEVRIVVGGNEYSRWCTCEDIAATRIALATRYIAHFTEIDCTVTV